MVNDAIVSVANGNFVAAGGPNIEINGPEREQARQDIVVAQTEGQIEASPLVQRVKQRNAAKRFGATRQISENPRREDASGVVPIVVIDKTLSMSSVHSRTSSHPVRGGSEFGAHNVQERVEECTYLSIDVFPRGQIFRLETLIVLVCAYYQGEKQKFDRPKILVFSYSTRRGR